MRSRAPRAVYALLFAYIAISLTYQLVASVSLVNGFFNMRHQVVDPGLVVDPYQPVITSVTDAAQKAGLAVGETVESVDEVPYTGRAQLQADRWYARPGETLRVGVRKPDGTRTVIAIPLQEDRSKSGFGEAVFVLVLTLVIPLACLLAGYWVALARPTDPNAWFS